ncbi:MAG: glutathione transferase GstA [Betaproteobacteria bacterium]|nr:glutathione transferase GstA [Betaproteobacteria bacterium]
MKLYYAPGACSLAPHIVLAEAGIAADFVKVDLKTHQTEAGVDYYTINPKGSVPLLELDNGERLTEVSAIVQYLADQKSGTGLAPAAGTFERYRLQEWLNFVSSELHKQYSPFFNPATPDAYKEMVTKKLGERFAYLTKHFKDRDYLLGDKFSVADAYLFTILRWSKSVGIQLEPWPVLTEFLARVRARAKVSEVMKHEGLAN